MMPNCEPLSAANSTGPQRRSAVKTVIRKIPSLLITTLYRIKTSRDPLDQRTNLEPRSKKELARDQVRCDFRPGHTRRKGVSEKFNTAHIALVVVAGRRVHIDFDRHAHVCAVCRIGAADLL